MSSFQAAHRHQTCSFSALTNYNAKFVKGFPIHQTHSGPAASNSWARLAKNYNGTYVFMAITAAATVEMVRGKFPRAIVETSEFRGEQTIVLQPQQLVAVCAFLHKNLQYTFLSSITA